jgi:hypothetical protein
MKPSRQDDTARRIKVRQKESLYSLFLNHKNSAKMLHNVPAVYEVSGGVKMLCEAKTAAANLSE